MRMPISCTTRIRKRMTVPVGSWTSKGNKNISIHTVVNNFKPVPPNPCLEIEGPRGPGLSGPGDLRPLSLALLVLAHHLFLLLLPLSFLLPLIHQLQLSFLVPDIAAAPNLTQIMPERSRIKLGRIIILLPLVLARYFTLVPLSISFFWRLWFYPDSN